MKTYVNVIDDHGEDYYFAEVGYETGVITIARHQGLYKVKEKEIYPCDVHSLTIDKAEDEWSIRFYHGAEQYTFFDSGNGIIPYLNMKLYPFSFSKVI